MLRLTSKINIAGYDFDFVNEVEIASNYEDLTDTCRITIPRNIKLDGKDLVIGENSALKIGDKVTVQLGYDENFKSAFIGYITDLSLNLPLVITCEDSMYLLKKKTLDKTYSYKSVSLSTLLKDIMPSNITYKANFEQKNLGELRIASTETVATVLEFLRKEFKVYSYFIDEVLNIFIGGEFKVQNRIDHTFKFEDNIIDNDLKYQKDGDLKIKIKATANYDETNDKGKRVTKKRNAWYPSEFAEGSVKQFNYYGNLSDSELKKRAEDEYKNFAYEGYTGTFTTFGAPFVKPTDGVKLQSDKLPERNGGLYLVKKVTRNFGVNGYRQKIELGTIIVVS
jgi:hypothetical protein